MAKRKNIFTHPRRLETKKRWGRVIIVLILIAGVFFLLENLKGRFLRSAKTEPVQSETNRMPPRETVGYEQKIYTSALNIPESKSRRAALAGTIAIVVDDMGSSLQEARSLLAINIPLTFSIIPGLAKSREVAEAAHAKGMEVMLHIPMEPQGYPEQRLEKNGLFMVYGADEILNQVKNYLQTVPYVVGANNHMGSRFTEHEEKMLPVVTILKEKQLFFIDSRTTPKSVGYSLALKMGVAAGSRNIFLDNEQDVAAIKIQLAEAAKMAKRRAGVIAICHPHPETIKALQEMMPEMQKSGITFVAASRIVR